MRSSCNTNEGFINEKEKRNCRLKRRQMKIREIYFVLAAAVVNIILKSSYYINVRDCGPVFHCTRFVFVFFLDGCPVVVVLRFNFGGVYCKNRMKENFICLK